MSHIFENQRWYEIGKDPHLVRMAYTAWQVIEARNHVWPEPCRIARLPDPRGPGLTTDILDPAWVTRHEGADSHLIARARKPDPDYHVWRTRNVIANLPHLDCAASKHQDLGRAFHIVGSGPSAKLAAEYIPAWHRRNAKVIALNRSIELVDADYWCVVDALRPGDPWGDPEGWFARTPVAAHNASNAIGLFNPHVHPWLTSICAMGTPSFYLPASDEHRDLIRSDISAACPTLVEGTQGLIPAMHWAFWLGASVVVLWGCDQGKPLASDPYYHDGSDHGRERDKETWINAPGVGGTTVRTTPSHAWCALQTSAMSMWLYDAGVPVWNCSNGMDYTWAPWMPPSHVIDTTERMTDVRRTEPQPQLSAASDGDAH